MSSLRKYALGLVLLLFPVLSIVAVNAAGKQVEQPPSDEVSPIEKEAAAGAKERTLMAMPATLRLEDEEQRQWVVELNKLTIKPGEVFSLDRWSKELQDTNGWRRDDETLSMIGSALLYMAVQANFEIAERYLHKELPAQLLPGYDVDFKQDDRDLLLYNPHSFAVDVRVDITNEIARIKLFGTSAGAWQMNEIEVRREVLAPGAITVFDYGADAKARTIAGSEGYLVSVYSSRKDGTQQLLYKDYYAPVPLLTYRKPVGEGSMPSNQ